MPPFDEDLGVYVVGGDLMMTPAEVQMYRGASGALAVQRWLGINRTWTSTVARNLSFCVSDQFEDKRAILESMLSATSQWEAADVRFHYRPEQDTTCESSRSVVLRVLPMPKSKTNVKAMAAFPPVSGLPETLDVYFETGGAYANVVVHELGHTLGFAHEQDHPDFPVEGASQQCLEDRMDWFSLSGVQGVGAFDPASVMLYEHCGGTGLAVLGPNEVARAIDVYGAGTPRTIGTTPYYFKHRAIHTRFPAGRYKFVAQPAIATLAFGPGIVVEHNHDRSISIVTFEQTEVDPDIFAPAIAKVYRLD